MNNYFLRILFERLLPPVVVAFTYFSLSIILIWDPALLPMWVIRASTPFLVSILVIQWIQLFILLYSVVFRARSKTRMGQDDLVFSIRTFASIGIFLTVLYVGWGITQGMHWTSVFGITLSAGYFLELLVREYDALIASSVFRELIYGSLATAFIGLLLFFSLYKNVPLNFNDPTRFIKNDYNLARAMAGFGMVFFGFKILWNFYLAKWAADNLEKSQ